MYVYNFMYSIVHNVYVWFHMLLAYANAHTRSIHIIYACYDAMYVCMSVCLYACMHFACLHVYI